MALLTDILGQAFLSIMPNMTKKEPHVDTITRREFENLRAHHQLDKYVQDSDSKTSYQHKLDLLNEEFDKGAVRLDNPAYTAVFKSDGIYQIEKNPATFGTLLAFTGYNGRHLGSLCEILSNGQNDEHISPILNEMRLGRATFDGETLTAVDKYQFHILSIIDNTSFKFSIRDRYYRIIFSETIKTQKSGIIRASVKEISEPNIVLYNEPVYAI